MSRWFVNKYAVSTSELRSFTQSDLETADRRTTLWRGCRGMTEPSSPLSRGQFLDELREAKAERVRREAAHARARYEGMDDDFEDEV